MRNSRFAATSVFALASVVVGCATTFPPSRVADRCSITSAGTLAISVSLIELAPGESVRLPKPMLFTTPHSPPDTLPTGCDVRWSVGDGGTIAGDGEVTIARDAAPGSTVLVRARVDTLEARQLIDVVDPAPNALAGTWTQDGPAVCANGERPSDTIVRELVFRRGGTFTVTRIPFESYRDYWGTYVFDAASARLTLSVRGGNSGAGFTTTELAARVAGDRLSLEGVPLIGSDPGPAQVCRSVFRRTGDAQ